MSVETQHPAPVWTQVHPEQHMVIPAAIRDRDGDAGSAERGRLALVRFGILLGDPVTDQPDMMNATFPLGWRSIRQNESTTAHILDNQGRARLRLVTIRTAGYPPTTTVLHRFRVYRDYRAQRQIVVRIADASARRSGGLGYGAEIYATEPVGYGTDSRRADTLQQAAFDEAWAWLLTRYPDARSLTAHWD
ncbi:hypothetical protein JNJ66_01045 [Candidatus Saccharibacteria bacterium]|nr:hypothetical protein [Candidatus Saccharibacteria bacterium]